MGWCRASPPPRPPGRLSLRVAPLLRCSGARQGAGVAPLLGRQVFGPLPTPPIPERTMLALCVYDEARGQSLRGQRAVARVILNRCHRRYSSDGTISSTVLWPNQFSGFWFDAVKLRDGRWRYMRVCHSREDALARAASKLVRARANPEAWKDATSAALLELNGSVIDPDPTDPAFNEDVVLYYNPAVTLGTPKWAMPENLVCTIGAHAFYKG